MSRKIETASVLVFDYGNTLIEFGPKQMREQYQALYQCLEEMGPFDPHHLSRVYQQLREAPLQNGFRENHLPHTYATLLREILGIDPSKHRIDRMLKKRHDAFVASVHLSPEVPSVLRELRRRFRFSMISNYPYGKAIRSSLTKIGISELFESVVISGDVGYVKPHPRPFEVLLDHLSVQPRDCIFIGDNWHADIQGAKRIGMQAILTTQFEPYRSFPHDETDVPPDARIEHLRQLLELLL